MPALDDVPDRHERFQSGIWLQAAARESDRANRVLRLLDAAVDRLAELDPDAAATIVATLEGGLLCLNSFRQVGSVSANHRCTLFVEHGGDCVFATRGAKSGDYAVSRQPQPERLNQFRGATAGRSA